MADFAFGANGVLEPKNNSLVLAPQEWLEQKRQVEQGAINPEMAGAEEPEEDARPSVLSPQAWMTQKDLGFGGLRTIEKSLPQPYVAPPLSGRQAGAGPQGLAVDSQYTPVATTAAGADAQNTLRNFVQGAIAGQREVNREQTALDNMANYAQPYMPAAKERLDFAATPKEGYTQNDVDYQKALLGRAKDVNYHETVLPGAMAIAPLFGTVAGAVPILAGLGETAVKTYENTEGSPMVKAGSAARAATYGHLADLLKDRRRLAKELKDRPVSAGLDLLMATGQAALPLYGAAKGVRGAKAKVREIRDKYNEENEKSAAGEGSALNLQQQEIDNSVKSQDLDAMPDVADAYEQQDNRANGQGIGNYALKQGLDEGVMVAPGDIEGLKLVIREGFKERPLDKKIITGIVDANEALIIKQKTGLDIPPGFTHGVGSYEVRHSRKSHAVESDIKRGHIPLVEEDYLNIPKVTRPEYLLRTEKGKRGDVLIYEKAINGHIFVVEEVRTGRKSLSFLSMRKLKRSYARVVPDDTGLPPTSSSGGLHPGIPERSLTSNTNILPGKDTVNNHILGNKGRGEPLAEEVRQRSGEAFPQEETVAGSGQAKNAVQNIRDILTDEKGRISPGRISEALPYIYDLGKKVLAEGFTTAHHWYNRMREQLGDLWRHFKDHMGNVWRTINNERGRAGNNKQGNGNSNVEQSNKTNSARINDVANGGRLNNGQIDRGANGTVQKNAQGVAEEPGKIQVTAGRYDTDNIRRPEDQGADGVQPEMEQGVRKDIYSQDRQSEPERPAGDDAGTAGASVARGGEPGAREHRPTKRGESGHEERVLAAFGEGERRVNPDGTKGTVYLVEAKEPAEKSLQKVGDKLGVDVRFYEGDSSADGFISPQHPDIVFVHRNAQIGIAFIFGHELVHSIKRVHIDLYQRLRDTVEKAMDNKGFYEAVENYIGGYYGGEEYLTEIMKDPERVIEEMLADEGGNNFNKIKFWQDLKENAPKVVEKIIDIALELIGKLVDIDWDSYFSKNAVDSFAAEFISTIYTVADRAQRQEMRRILADIDGPEVKFSQGKGKVAKP